MLILFEFLEYLEDFEQNDGCVHDVMSIDNDEMNFLNANLPATNTPLSKLFNDKFLNEYAMHDALFNEHHALRTAQFGDYINGVFIYTR